MSLRNYANEAPTATTTASLTSVATTVPVSSTVGDPTSYPYTAVLGYQTGSAEIVLVTGAAGLNYTVVRGYDGDTAVSHPAGETFDPVATAIDFREANTHINTSVGVHGRSTALVGVDDVQTLTNKTLTNPVIVGVLSDLKTATLEVSSNETVGGTLAVTGAISGPSLVVTGAVSGASSTSTGSATAATVVGTTSVTAPSVVATGALSGASAAISGNETIGGSLAVTGLITGSHVITQFATPTARDTALPTPTAGQLCHVTSLTQDQVYSGSAWVPLTAGSIRFKGAIVSAVACTAGATVKWGTPVEDTASGYSNTTGLYTIPQAGTWMASAQVVWGTAVASGVAISKNGVSVKGSNVAGAGASNGGGAVAGYMRFAVGDTTGVSLFSTLTTLVTAIPEQTFFDLMWVGP